MAFGSSVNLCATSDHSHGLPRTAVVSRAKEAVGSSVVEASSRQPDSAVLNPVCRSGDFGDASGFMHSRIVRGISLVKAVMKTTLYTLQGSVMLKVERV